jgi:hypothetical protein
MGLLLAAVLLPLMLMGWNAVTIIIASVWAFLLIAIFGWRWAAHLANVDAKWRNRRH